MDLNASHSLNSTCESQSSAQQTQQESSSLLYGKQGMFRSASMNEEKMQSSKIQDNIKRKKSKLRNSTIPPNPNSYYPKELDVWLENCIKDISAPQLSSSSEFLDYNTSSFNSNKNFTQSQNMFNNNNKPSQAHNRFNPGFPKLFQNDNTSSNNSFDVNKFFRNLDHMQSDSPGEFASLPPLMNFGPNNGDSCTENLDSNDPSRSFRFSDPCLIGTSDNESAKISEQTQNASEKRQTTTNDTNKFLTALLEQINVLHETNSKICRNLHETKVEIEALKHTSWGLRHRRDSLSGLSTHSQPLGFAFGNQSPAPTYHSGAYTPGMMTDVVREVKEAARVREEALLNRVKAMVEERSWSFGEGNIRLMRDIEDMKVQIQHLRSDRKETNKRITQLEAENKYLKSILISMLNNKTVEIMNENEHIRSRKNFNADSVLIGRSQKKNDMNINHGGSLSSMNPGEILQQNYSTNERNQMPLKSGLNMNQLNYDRKNTSLTDSVSSHSQNGSTRTVELFSTENERNNDEGGGGGGGVVTGGRGGVGGTGGIEGSRIMQIEKDTLELRRELQEAIASKKQAENRVIALESMVKHLQVKVTHVEDYNSSPNVLNGSITISAKDILKDGSSSSQNNLSNLAQFTSQMQNTAPKLSISGPITDL